MPETMQALITGRGPDWVVATVPRPSPDAGEVLIRVQAAATNNGDLPMLAAADPSQGGSGDQSVAGFEYAGEIVALGDDIDAGWNIGDPVMGSIAASFAEYVSADERFVLPRPVDLAAEIACALPTGLFTEHGALNVANFTAGQSVLITGATTGIGLIGVQLAKMLGASTVIGTTRTVNKKDLLTGVGADTVVVTDQEDLVDATRSATGGDGVDVVLDHVGGQTFADSIRAVKDFGTVVNVGRVGGATSTIDLDALSYNNRHVHGVSFSFSRPEQMAKIIAALLPEVIPAVARGAIRPVIDRTVSMADPAQAAARLRSGQAQGKVVLTTNKLS